MGSLQQQVADLVKDRDHWRTMAEAERRPLARRPWPGLRAWWRLLEGEG